MFFIVIFSEMSITCTAFQQGISTRLSTRSYRHSDQFRSALPSMEEDPIAISQTLPRECNVTLSFPPFSDLISMSKNQFVSSEKVTLNLNGTAHSFRVNLYPRGGGHKSSSSILDQKSGFGMSYRVLPVFGPEQPDRVAVYLQYLPEREQDCVDASFGLRLKGNQKQGPKFDVEWRAGIRFVHSKYSKLSLGRANDFGSHLMNTCLLKEFCGYQEHESGKDAPVEVQVEILLHSQKTISEVLSVEPTNWGSTGFDDIRHRSPSSINEPVRAGQIVVPVLRKLSQRPKMFELGAYPGVEYRILRIIDPVTKKDQFYSSSDAIYEMRPIYPLVPQLERMWPVAIKESDIPKLFTSFQYNTLSALGSLATALGGLMTAFLISQAISLYFIPSRSMDPTLQVGDVLLVEKVTPRIFGSRSPGDVVLFQPPEKLRNVVQQSGGQIKDRDLFIKRIAAGPGSEYSVEKTGDIRIDDRSPPGRRDLCEAEPMKLIERFIEPTSNVIVGSDEIVVLGDCSSVSVDSRVWGPLPEGNVVGRPLLRIWPLSRFGSIPPLPD